jgi:hypothetical protein
MKTLPLIAAALCCLFTAVNPAFAQGTAFTYQGHLNDGSGPANGTYDIQFTLYTTNVTGSALAGPVTNSATALSNGLFTATIDFGPGVFTGTNCWLDLAVRTNGVATFTELTPRQPITPTPYAIFANTASNVSGMVSASQLSGPIPVAQLPSSIITNGASGINISGTFSGNGGGLANVSGATAGNYVYAYATTTQQSLYVTNITFNSFIQTNGWNYNPTNATFTASQSGLYLIQYNASMHTVAGSANSWIDLWAVSNSAHVSGSDVVTYLATNNVSGNSPIITYASKSFIANVNSGQQLAFSLVTSDGELLNYANNPSFSVTIVRLQ